MRLWNQHEETGQMLPLILYIDDYESLEDNSLTCKVTLRRNLSDDVMIEAKQLYSPIYCYICRVFYSSSDVIPFRAVLSAQRSSYVSLFDWFFSRDC